MRDRKGARGRATGIAEGVATVVRRRAHERGPRVLLYDAAGEAGLLSPDSPGFDRLIDTVEALVELDQERRREEAQTEETATGEAVPEEAEKDPLEVAAERAAEAERDRQGESE